MLLIKVTFPSTRTEDTTEVCRFRWLLPPAHFTKSNLQLKLNEISGARPGTYFNIFFLDGRRGELVKIIEDADLVEALRQKEQPNAKLQIVRLYAVPTAHDTSKKLKSFIWNCHENDLPEILSKAKETLNERSEVENLLKCHLCERECWDGPRYTCLFCTKVGLCNLCFEAQYHLDHPLLVTHKDDEYACLVIQEARSAAATVPWSKCLQRIHLPPTLSHGDKSPSVASGQITPSNSNTGPNKTSIEIISPSWERGKSASPQSRRQQNLTAENERRAQRLQEMGYNHKPEELFHALEKAKGDISLAIEYL